MRPKVALSDLLQRAGVPAAALARAELPPSRYQNLGIDDEVTICEHCGKANLKCTVVLGVLDEDGAVQAEVRFGRDCAARALRPSLARKPGAAEKMEREARQVTLTRLRAAAPRTPDVVIREGGWVTANRWPLPDGRYLVQQLAMPWDPAKVWGGEWKVLQPDAWWVGRPGGGRG